MTCGGIQRKQDAGKIFLETIHSLLADNGQAMLTNNILSQAGLSYKESHEAPGAQAVDNAHPNVPRDKATENFWKAVLASGGVGDLIFGTKFPVPPKLALSKEGGMSTIEGLYAWYLANKKPTRTAASNDG